MFSHIVVFYTNPEVPNAPDELLAGIDRLLRPIPGSLHISAGKMVPSSRPVVQQDYQVALNMVFANKKAHDDYQVHPKHLDFVENVFKKTCTKVVIYDFE